MAACNTIKFAFLEHVLDLDGAVFLVYLDDLGNVGIEDSVVVNEDCVLADKDAASCSNAIHDIDGIEDCPAHADLFVLHRQILDPPSLLESSPPSHTSQNPHAPASPTALCCIWKISSTVTNTLPAWISKTFEFMVAVEDSHLVAKSNSLSTIDRWRAHTKDIKEAA